VLAVEDALADACLRPAFRDPPGRTHRATVQRVLVTTGGGDPGGAGARLALATRAALPDASVALVRGPQADPRVPEGIEPIVCPDSLLEHLLAADVAVSGAGQTMLEACAAGTPCVALPLAEDQRPQGEQASTRGAVVYIEEDRLAAALEALAEPDARVALSRQARTVVDGRGAFRVAERIARLVA
jgi:spore coat polysaccharide biosynthesis predicted glycosyltransferase SpsG